MASQSAPANINVTDTAHARRRRESLAKLDAAARKLFVERGYHATRPQDIMREAGLGHGTFYLHYPDKRACFLEFVAQARRDLDEFIRERFPEHPSFIDQVAISIEAMFIYSEKNPGVLKAAMTDAAVIDAEGGTDLPLLTQWGRDWARSIRSARKRGEIPMNGYDPEIIGQVVVGAISQASTEGFRARQAPQAVIDNLVRFITRALQA